MPGSSAALILDFTDDAVWIVDKMQRVLQTNTAAQKLFDRPITEMVGRPCWEVVLPKRTSITPGVGRS